MKQLLFNVPSLTPFHRRELVEKTSPGHLGLRKDGLVLQKQKLTWTLNFHVIPLTPSENIKGTCHLYQYTLYFSD